MGKDPESIIDRADSIELSGNVCVYYFPADCTGSRRGRLLPEYVHRMEVFAPVFSYHLDNFKNRQVKEKDYSIGEVLQPDGRYAMYYEGGEKIILSPNEELVKALKNVAPRKVFSE